MIGFIAQALALGFALLVIHGIRRLCSKGKA